LMAGAAPFGFEGAGFVLNWDTASPQKQSQPPHP
jgi:hypothetical protein